MNAEHDNTSPPDASEAPPQATETAQSVPEGAGLPVARRRRSPRVDVNAEAGVQVVGAVHAEIVAAPDSGREPFAEQRVSKTDGAQEISAVGAVDSAGYLAEAARQPESAAQTAAPALPQPFSLGDPMPGFAEIGNPGSDSSRRRRRDRPPRRDGQRQDVDATAQPEEGTDQELATQSLQAPAEPVVPTNSREVFAEVLSGAFDTAAEPVGGEDASAAIVHKRVLAPDVESPKLHKVLAQSGIGSRRDMEQLILDGFVTVNGEVAHTGQRVSFGDQVKVKGKPVRLRIVPQVPRILAYHKPAGEIVTHDDPQQRPTVFRRLPRLQQGKWQAVGRLDINTEGLLLFTTSGELANQLMHPRFGVEREYAVRVLGILDEQRRADLLEGVQVEGQMASFQSIEDGGGEGANHWYRVVITEGRNREVRRLFDAVGLTVSRLIRIRYGTVVLPRGLKRGVWVDLDDADVRTIRRLASPERSQAGPRPKQGRPEQPRRQERPPRRAPEQYGAPGDAPRPENDEDIDFDPAQIPNPLEQTFDKRFVQGGRGSSAPRGFGRPSNGFGPGGSAPPARRGGNPKEPDPLQTSVGYIGADAVHRKNRGGRGGNRGGGGFSGGFGGGGRPGR